MGYDMVAMYYCSVANSGGFDDFVTPKKRLSQPENDLVSQKLHHILHMNSSLLFHFLVNSLTDQTDWNGGIRFHNLCSRIQESQRTLD